MLGVNIETHTKYVKLTCKFVRKKEIRQSEKISILYYIQDVTEVKMNVENEASLLISDFWKGDSNCTSDI